MASSASGPPREAGGFPATDDEPAPLTGAIDAVGSPVNNGRPALEGCELQDINGRPAFEAGESPDIHDGPAVEAGEPSDSSDLAHALVLYTLGKQRLENGDARGALKPLTECREHAARMKDSDTACVIDGNAQANLGLAYHRLGDYQKAIDHLNPAIAISCKLGDLAGESNLRGALGNAFCITGQYNEAIDHLLPAANISRDLSDRQSEGRHRAHLGGAYSSIGQYAEAIQQYTAAREISRELKDRRGEVSHLGNLGCAYRNLGQYDAAIEQYTIALEISRSSDDRQRVGRYLADLGITYRLLGRYDEAVKKHEEGFPISHGVDDRRSECAHLSSLGSAYHGLGQHDKAVELFKAAVAISKERRDRPSVAYDLCNLGSVYRSSKQYDKAIVNYTAALAINRELGDRRAEASTLGNLGSTYGILGQYLYDKAIEQHTHALSISRDISDARGEDSHLCNLGVVFAQRGQYDDAIKQHKDGLALCSKYPDRAAEASHLCNLGIIHLQLAEQDKKHTGPNHKKAVELLQTALKIDATMWHELQSDLQRVKHGETSLPVIASLSLQRAHILVGQPKLALECAEQTRARAFELLLAQRRLRQSVPFALPDTSQTPSDSATHATAGAPSPQGYRVTARSQTIRDSPPALDFQSLTDLAVRQRVAIVIFSRISREQLFVWVLGSRQGSNLFFQAITVPSKDRSLALLVECTRRLVGARGRHGRAVAPSRSTDMMNGSWLWDSLAVDDESMLWDLAAQYAPADAEGPANMSSDTPTARAHRIRLAVEAAQRQADEDARLETPAHDLPFLDQAEERYLNSTAAALLRRCHELLIEPLSAALTDEPNLLIVPDRELFALPFAALQDANHKYLIESHTLRIASSAGVLLQLEMEQQARSRGPASITMERVAVVVGNPSFQDWTTEGDEGRTEYLPNLPHAENEALDVAELLRRSAFDVALLRNEDATKEAVLKAMLERGVEVLHLATHGTSDGIVFTGRSKADATLSMDDVDLLKLHARIAVLSACDTFKGEMSADGVMGISGAFVAAGVPTLVSSLWKVHDKGTYLLMQCFYKLLLGEERLDAATALQQAMVKMIHSPDQIRIGSWAAFVVYGLSSALPVASLGTD